MKTMKTLGKISLVIIVSTLFTIGLSAQEFNFPLKNAKKLVIEKMQGDIIIEGHNSSELRIKTDDHHCYEKPKKAEGLRSLYNTKEENTGIGLSISEVDGIIEIEPATRSSEDTEYTILIPKNLFVKIDYSGPFAEDVIVKNLTGEVEISTLNGDIDLFNITGPTAISSINGDIKCIFSEVSQQAPISISSVNGELDITIPSNTKADLVLSTFSGDIFTDMDIEFDKKSKEGLSIIGGNKIKGTLNGGGVDILLNTINDNIYLRKAK
jgi:hypothetical protein